MISMEAALAGGDAVRGLIAQQGAAGGVAWRASAWASEHWFSLTTSLSTLLIAMRMRRMMRLQTAERWRERRMREELEAYARLDASMTRNLSDGMEPARAARMLAQRVCRTVAEKSVFTRVAMLLRDAEGRLTCVGSIGVDDRTLAALNGWAADVVSEERGFASSDRASEQHLVMMDAATMARRAVSSELRISRERLRAGAPSFSIPLGEWRQFDAELATWALQGKRERRRWRRALVAPFRTTSGRVLGALVVCADGRMVDGGAGAPRGQATHMGAERAMSSIEALATKLARTMENEALAERLLRAEKLAGLGQLAGGVAHALNNPLTAVLGFAELIAESSNEPRVRTDALTIAREALKMRDTVERLIDFWRPSQLEDAPVELAEICDELADACREKLTLRGVRLEVTTSAKTPPVRGSRDRLRQVMEHLLNNAAQAIATARPREEGEEHAIRITISADERMLHVILSDTGPGFAEPGRIFDPFYTTRQPGEGTGLGLSICYGIVREHGGEISAFNLHPHGAAVVIELPVAKTVQEADVMIAEEPPVRVRA